MQSFYVCRYENRTLFINHIIHIFVLHILNSVLIWTKDLKLTENLQKHPEAETNTLCLIL